MSHYESKMKELRELGLKPWELGEEVAICEEYVYAGGDAPTAWECAGITGEQAQELAMRGRRTGEDAQRAYDEYVERIGAREVPWN